MSRIPSLDGIRAVSILLVLLAHLAGTRGFPLRHHALPLDVGNLGVRVFFVISGFLITGLLLDEVARHGSIDLRRFYFKRTFRIFPAYYALISVTALAASVGLIELLPGDLFHALTYTTNYDPERAWGLGHAWSLAVEEQFYLIWPAVLLFAGLRRGFWIAIGFVALVPVWRVVLLALPDGALGLGLLQAANGNGFDTVGDAIAVGCLLAMLRERLWASASYRRFLASPAIVVLPLFVILVPMTPFVATRVDGTAEYVLLALYQLVGLPGVHIAIAVMIDWAVRNPGGRVGAILNHRRVAQLGIMSYSLYLWQQPFLNRTSDLPITAFPLNLTLAVACAWLSYRLVEMPALALRDRLDRDRRTNAAAPATPAVPA